MLFRSVVFLFEEGSAAVTVSASEVWIQEDGLVIVLDSAIIVFLVGVGPAAVIVSGGEV